jgi:hypothetical protein
MDIVTEIIQAHREHVSWRRARDRLIRIAIAEGRTGYAIAQQMKRELGEDDALAQNTIRLIGKGNKPRTAA